MNSRDAGRAAYEAIEALNWSTLRHLSVSPKMLRHRIGEPRKETPALKFGTAVHCALLEPDRWALAYAAQPDFGDLRTKAARADRDEWETGLSAGAIVLKAEDYARAERSAAAVREHRDASALLRGGRREETITWRDEPTGLACKGRLDYITPSYLVDLKTTRFSTLRDIERACASLLYHAQAAWYHDGAVAAGKLGGEPRGPYLVAVQSEAPHDVAAFRLGPEALRAGRQVYRGLLTRYVQCLAADWWPGIAPVMVELELPAWAAPIEGTLEEEGW